MAEVDSSEKVSGITVQDVANRVAAEWDFGYQKNPDLYHDMVTGAIRQSIVDEIRVAASNIIRDGHDPQILTLMGKAIDKWIADGDVVIDRPSSAVIAAINNCLSSLTKDGTWEAFEVSKDKKLAVFKLRQAGVSFKDIASKFGVGVSAAQGIYQRAKNDIDSAEKILKSYGSNSAKKSRAKKKR